MYCPSATPNMTIIMNALILQHVSEDIALKAKTGRATQ
jgi:hypothetical protein